ncbi:hypothetical protein ALC57_14194 [Trachymyrmex cornetzi]|uniref:Uncharacterized protein n=1 Tax=Trachymyrmex cornetzi TaxID=471704 RepID=A0A151IYP4_9HYME|nr:hypothetical protein ALC57_14194 [Trachymyrmex cornetzi]
MYIRLYIRLYVRLYITKEGKGKEKSKSYLKQNFIFYSLNLIHFFWRCDHQLCILNTFCSAQFLLRFPHRIVLVTSRLCKESVSL